MTGVPWHLRIGGLLASITAVTMFESNFGLVAHAAAVAIGDGIIVMGGGSKPGQEHDDDRADRARARVPE